MFPADLNDLLLSKERVLQNNSLDLKSLRLKLDNMVAERNTYEQTLHEMNGRHVKQAREEYDSNEASRRRLMNHIVTLRLTVATLHESNGGEHVGGMFGSFFFLVTFVFLTTLLVFDNLLVFDHDGVARREGGGESGGGGHPG